MRRSRRNPVRMLRLTDGGVDLAYRRMLDHLCSDGFLPFMVGVRTNDAPRAFQRLW